MTRTCRIAALFLAGWTMAPGPAAAATAPSPKIQVADLFDDVVDDLRGASPTFDRQYGRIAALPNVYVSVRMLPKGEESCCRARTTMRRYQSGALIAWVEIPSPRTREEYAELLGHEFEHILEQMESTDLGIQAGDGSTSRLANGAYETVRARRAGEAVAAEAGLRGTTSEGSRLPR